MQHVRVLAVLMFSLLAASPALAVQPDEVLKDPTLEARARSISAGLRCLVCQNQSIDDSDAGVARDLRILIREQLQQDKSDEQVVAFVVDRYGEYVLLKPRLSARTLVLWLTPFVILLVGAAVLLRRRPASQPAVDSLSEAEKQALDAILRK
jgi:cytochrome c-type biogenesis protein CcmH